MVVEDLLIVALGDSFASGDSNPDRPVVFSARREMVYDPTLLRDDIAALKKQLAPVQTFGLASVAPDFDPKTLPRRRMEDEDRDIAFRLASREFTRAFERAGARWLSPDCHRSLYGYPMRVGLELALENRRRAVTLISLACTGSEVADGLFLPREAREGFTEPGGARVPPQFDQLAELMCAGPRCECAHLPPAGLPARLDRDRRHAGDHGLVRRVRRSSGRSTSCCCRSAAMTSASPRSRSIR